MKIVHRMKGNPGKTYGIVNRETGNVEYITNMAEYCRKHNLNYTAMINVANKYYPKYAHGLKPMHIHDKELRESEFIKFNGVIHHKTKKVGNYEYHIKSPNGRMFITRNLKKFCKEYFLDENKVRLWREGAIDNLNGYMIINRQKVKAEEKKSV